MSSNSPEIVRVIDSAVGCPELPLVEGKGNVKVVLWPGNGGRFRSIQLFELGGDARTISLKHSTDCVYGVISGSGIVRGLAEGGEQRLEEGAMIHIDAGDDYRIEAGDEGMVFLGGPCPPDPALYETIGHLMGALK